MFTGIVEEIGTVRYLNSASGNICIDARTVLEGTDIGDSIAVNGVCLTVTRMESHSFTADVMPETLRKSNLGELRQGGLVDLERAMPANGRFGGHIVSGHIDGTGVIAQRRAEGNAVWVRISAAPEILRLTVEKGSIAIDGISLTVAAVSDTYFEVSLIPHTAEKTVLLSKKVGDTVNLENDIVGKYVQKLMQPTQAETSGSAAQSRVTEEFLAENGFF